MKTHKLIYNFLDWNDKGYITLFDVLWWIRNMLIAIIVVYLMINAIYVLVHKSITMWNLSLVAIGLFCIALCIYFACHIVVVLAKDMILVKSDEIEEGKRWK